MEDLETHCPACIFIQGFERNSSPEHKIYHGILDPAFHTVAQFLVENLCVWP